MNPTIDIANTAFSRFGSYMAVSRLEGDRAPKNLPSGIWLRNLHGDAADEVMHLALFENGAPVPVEAQATAAVLTLRGQNGRAEICLPTEDTVRIRVTGATLRISARPFRNHGAIPEPDGTWVFNLARTFHSYRLLPLAGDFSVDAPWTVKRCKHIIADLSARAGETAELAIEELSWMRPAQKHDRPFEEVAEGIRQEFETFCQPFLACPEGLRQTAAAAAHLNWSSVVHPHRLLRRPAMYMSKNWMANVWAWDHAFNALATSLNDPDLAWDQFMVIFDHQDKSGQIPDFVNDVRYLTVFVKPPIHGWILRRMIQIGGPLPPKRLEQAYPMLSKWTNWWFRWRDPDGDGLPVYWHGNDSGWDNGSVFDVTLPLKSPDLAAFLVLQMDVLARFAEQLGHAEEAESWHHRAERTLAALIDKLWDGSRFRALSTVTRNPATPTDSVFGCLPIILGKRLPAKIRGALATEIRRHLTEWGPATEHPDSPLYDPDGYWRGPIWAPPTLILVDGLTAAGETELAIDIAKRFCRLCAKNGFAENFNALTGHPLRDRGYTWTSSVFLILSNVYLDPAMGRLGEPCAEQAIRPRR